MSDKEANASLGKVTVTLKIPEPVYHFFGAVASTYNKKLEEILVEELINDIKRFTDTEAEKILIGAFELEQYTQ
ncbi:MAG: hypothetical protein JW702_07965 [Clostridiales bacterium]|nr:hypothetical protein [Clostridiales bacterium]